MEHCTVMLTLPTTSIATGFPLTPNCNSGSASGTLASTVCNPRGATVQPEHFLRDSLSSVLAEMEVVKQIAAQTEQSCKRKTVCGAVGHFVRGKYYRICTAVN